VYTSQKGGRIRPNIPNSPHQTRGKRRRQANNRRTGQGDTDEGAKSEKVTEKIYFFTNRLKKISLFLQGVQCI
tara:strand:- start:1142 stop:1360 length:219 start_codon:yes stop_codon:yes gene_type:complete